MENRTGAYGLRIQSAVPVDPGEEEQWENYAHGQPSSDPLIYTTLDQVRQAILADIEESGDEWPSDTYRLEVVYWSVDDQTWLTFGHHYYWSDESNSFEEGS